MSDLTSRMGISRQSLYDTYGDKRSLFAAVLDRYREMVGTKVAELECEDAALPEVEGYLTTLAGMLQKDGERRACLFATTTMEDGMSEEQFASRLMAHRERLENAFRHALGNARQLGQVSADLEVKKYARYLCGFAQGLSLMVMSGAPGRELQESIEIALSDASSQNAGGVMLVSSASTRSR